MASDMDTDRILSNILTIDKIILLSSIVLLVYVHYMYVHMGYNNYVA